MTRLSVVVTFHNQADFVEQTLTSLRKAAFDDVEFVIVDDASTDSTPALLERAAASLPSVQLARTGDVPVGVSAARNLGSGLATGDWFGYLDGDDFVGPDHYRAALAAAERLKVDYLRTDHTRATGAEREVHRIPHGPRGVADAPRNGIAPAHRATSVDFPQPWTSLYHRRLYDRGLLEFPTDLRTCEDRFVTWRLHLNADSFAVVGLTSMFWRREVSGSLTRITDDRQLDFITAFDRIVEMVLADSEAERFIGKAVRNYLAMTHHHLRRTAEYGPTLSAELVARSTASYAKLPQDVLQSVYAVQDANRRRALRPIMKGI
ncbi:glycosyltransferase family 2 protein [Propionibacteriaceae bacterium Y1685]|uniref:glycosyltransferase family 2 protein n=1 Tax=Microlunatus sp. Y1700 TaxID=3418487 RepID=UPI003B82810B